MNKLISDFNSEDFISGVFSGFISGTIGVSTVFITKDMGNKCGRISVLTTPASTFEKWLLRWILCVPITLILVIVIFSIVNELNMIALKYLSSQHIINFWDYFNELHVLGYFIILMFIQSLFMVSAYYSPKSPAKLIIVIFCSVLLLGILYYGVGTVLKFSTFNIDIQMNNAIVEAVIFGGIGLLTVAGWILSYICFKKLEITDR